MLKKILRMTQTELYDFVVEELNKYYKKVITQEKKEFVAAKGDIPIVLVAHLDTVFNEEGRKEMLIFHDPEEDVTWSPNGLGTDDRAGVLMILRIIQKTKLRPCILFTTDEESIGTGAEAVAKKKQELFGDISYVIELDRQGYKECVFYDCDNPEFQKFIENFGFETKIGTFTDISIICPEWGVAGVNLSVGYYYEHSYIEYFYSVVWYDTYKKVIKMLETPCDRIWRYIPKNYEIKKEKTIPLGE